MKKTYAIGYDFDGTLILNERAKNAVALERYGRGLKPHEMLKEGFPFGKDEYKIFTNEVNMRHELFNPVPGSVRAIRRLADAGATSYVITSRGKSEFVHDRIAVTEYCRRLSLPIAGTHFTAGKPKKDACAALQLDSHIEDRITEIIPLTGTVPHLYLLAQFWNEADALPAGVARVEWEEFEYLEMGRIHERRRAH